jgi:phosphoserine phosphatase
MAAPQNIIAVVFDFDDTLTDDSTTRLLADHGIDPADFWQNRMAKLTDAGWDSPLAYLKLILDNVGDDKPFGRLSNKLLREFGERLSFYPGIPQLFVDLKEIAASHPLSNPAVEFYVVSGGIEEIIRGSSIAKHFTGIWGCRFHEEDGQVRHVANSITFTEKTKFLFAINKGIGDADSRRSPFAVNQAVNAEDRRVPFEHMIYLGDGLTDVPCFSLLEKNRGVAFGIFDPRKKNSPKKAWEQLVMPNRVKTIGAPEYGPEQILGSLLRASVGTICSQMDLRTQTAVRAHRASS